MNNLSTDFYKGPIPHPNYPRPQFKRENSIFMNLNGYWDYQIVKSQDEKEITILSGQILVPFPPESSLSGVNHILQPDETIIYTKSIEIDSSSPLQDFYKNDIEGQSTANRKGRLFLNIDACDYFADISINNQHVFKGEIGYIPHSIEITNNFHLGRNKITIRVQDPTDTGLQPIGKQSLNPKTIFYTSCSGIWQTIWLESTPCDYIKDIKITPSVSDNSVKIRYTFNSQNEETKKIKITVFDKKDHSKIIYSSEKVSHSNESELVLSFGDRKLDLWSPSSPVLYDFELEIGDDKISSYFGLREFEIKTMKNGQKRLTLNGSVCFMSGLLDQGYWPESNLCPPSEEAILSELSYVKKSGFNMIRKHIKIEPLRFYYHCDCLGLIVWQDIVNGAGPVIIDLGPQPDSKVDDSTESGHSILHRSDAKARKDFELFIGQSIDLLYNVCSIGLWTLFNEAWGQFDSVRLTKLIKEKFDHSRPIDSTSGWFDQGENIGVFLSLHIYFKKIEINRPQSDKRALILSEFGGYSLKSDDSHLFCPKDSFGYKEYESKESLQKGFSDLFRNEVFPSIEKGVCATVYTQLTDVETEINGLLSYDRKVQKLSPQFLYQLHQDLYEIGNKYD